MPFSIPPASPHHNPQQKSLFFAQFPHQQICRPIMEEEELVWEIGEIIAPREESPPPPPPLLDEPMPPLFEEPTPPPPVYLPASASSYAWADEPTPAPPVYLPAPPVYLPESALSITRGYATAADAAAYLNNKRGRVACTSKAIQGLREVTAPPADGSDDCCAICLQDLDFRRDPSETPGLRLRAMPCSHTFHEHCIFEWLRRNTVCPLCRHQLPTEDDHEQGRSKSRVVYNDADDRYYIAWHYTEQPFSDDDDEEEEEEEVVDPEQERRRTVALEYYANWLRDRAQRRSPS